MAETLHNWKLQTDSRPSLWFHCAYLESQSFFFSFALDVNLIKKIDTLGKKTASIFERNVTHAEEAYINPNCVILVLSTSLFSFNVCHVSSQ